MLHLIEFIADSVSNNTREICSEWSEIYNNCEVKSSGTVESTVSNQKPTETSGTSNRPGSVTNAPGTDTSQGSSRNKTAIIVGAIIGGVASVFILAVVVLTAIVCLRKRSLHKRSNHLINGPPVLELKCKHA